MRTSTATARPGGGAGRRASAARAGSRGTGPGPAPRSPGAGPGVGALRQSPRRCVTGSATHRAAAPAWPPAAAPAGAWLRLLVSAGLGVSARAALRARDDRRRRPSEDWRRSPGRGRRACGRTRPPGPARRRRSIGGGDCPGGADATRLHWRTRAPIGSAGRGGLRRRAGGPARAPGGLPTDRTVVGRRTTVFVRNSFRVEFSTNFNVRKSELKVKRFRKKLSSRCFENQSHLLNGDTPNIQISPW